MQKRNVSQEQGASSLVYMNTTVAHRICKRRPPCRPANFPQLPCGMGLQQWLGARMTLDRRFHPRDLRPVGRLGHANPPLHAALVRCAFLAHYRCLHERDALKVRCDLDC